MKIVFGSIVALAWSDTYKEKWKKKYRLERIIKRLDRGETLPQEFYNSWRSHIEILDYYTIFQEITSSSEKPLDYPDYDCINSPHHT